MPDINFTPQRYYQAAQKHLRLTVDLMGENQYFAAHYFAGIAIECMLRASGTPAGGAFDSSHSLDYWAAKSSLLRTGSEAKREANRASLNEANQRWRANQRYMTPKMLDTHLYTLGLDRVRGDLVKYSANRMLEIAAAVIETGVEQWKK